jgi:hypothetical protein
MKTKVIKRTWFPQGSDPNTATHPVIHDEILEGVSFASQIPSVFGKGKIARALRKREQAQEGDAAHWQTVSLAGAPDRALSR